jgi:hypothetical protein
MIGKIEHAMAEIIINIVSDYYGIHRHKIHSKTRVWDIVRARQVACYMIRKYTNISKFWIGKKYFNQDHSTIIHSIRVIESDIVANNRGTRQDIRAISEAIENQRSIRMGKFQCKYIVLLKSKSEPDMYYGFWDSMDGANKVLQDKIKPIVDMQQCESVSIIKVTSIE